MVTEQETRLWALLIAVLLQALFLHIAARALTRGPRIPQAIAVAVLGGLVALAALLLIAAPWSIILAAIAWIAVCAAVYRIGWIRALLLGLVAAALFLVAQLIVALIIANLPG